MFQDREHLSNALKQGIRQQCFKIGNISAMFKTRYTSAKFQDWEHLSNALRQGTRQESFKIGNSSEM